MMNSTHKAGVICFLCLMLCICGAYLLADSASADQTVVIISGEAAQQEPVIIHNNTAAATGSGTSTPVESFDGSGLVVFSAPTQGVVVNPSETVSVTKTVTVPATREVPAESVVAVQPEGLRNQLLALVNQARKENGLTSLGYSGKLQTPADMRAEESASSFQHARPDGRAAETVIPFDYTVTGENLIRVTTDYATADLMMQTWMGSETHRNNLLNASFRQMAVGVFESADTTYVSLIFTD